MGTGFLPFLCNIPASSETRLFFTRMTTKPSGINVKLIPSRVLMRRQSRISFANRCLTFLVSVDFVPSEILSGFAG